MKERTELEKEREREREGGRERHSSTKSVVMHGGHFLNMEENLFFSIHLALKQLLIEKSYKHPICSCDY
jgi:hypothetical protein